MFVSHHEHFDECNYTNDGDKIMTKMVIIVSGIIIFAVVAAAMFVVVIASNIVDNEITTVVVINAVTYIDRYNSCLPILCFKHQQHILLARYIYNS